MAIETSSYGEFPVSDDTRYTYISGVTFFKQRIEYAVVDEEAWYEGDILLGTAEEMELLRKVHEGEPVALPGGALEGLVISGARFRWPRGVVTFVIDDALPKKDRVFDAIRHWEEKTNVRFRERANERNYVYFTVGNGCGAHVGMRGGQQLIKLASGCSKGNTIHEIGHCIGLWHEHSREDREKFVQINWDNIKPRARHNFNQHIADGDDIYSYDYGSIMHYPSHAFAIDPSKPTIVSPQPIGQRKGLSEDDIMTVNTIYPRPAARD